jgi:hypothetical protein
MLQMVAGAAGQNQGEDNEYKIGYITDRIHCKTHDVVHYINTVLLPTTRLI